MDETNHAAVSLTPTEDDSSRWVSTLAPLTLLKAASKHAAKLNEHRMLYNVSDATKAATVTPTTVNFGLQIRILDYNVYNMEGLMGVDTSDVRKTIMFLVEGHRPTPICAPFEIFADEIHWELFANLFSSIYGPCANISRKWDSTNTGPVHPTYAAAYNLCEGCILIRWSASQLIHGWRNSS